MITTGIGAVKTTDPTHDISVLTDHGWPVHALLFHGCFRTIEGMTCNAEDELLVSMTEFCADKLKTAERSDVAGGLDYG